MKPCCNILVVNLLKYSLYDLGGQLCKIDNSAYYTYLDNVTYDRFGAKVSQEYGNGMVTNYSYNNLTRRLSIINTTNGNSSFSSQVYTYDPVGNVTQVVSASSWLQNMGLAESFTYDASDQMTSASETLYQSYQLSVNYGNWGKVNTYDLTQTDLLQNITMQNAYTLTYPTDPDNPQDAQTNFAPTMQLSGTGGTQTVMTQYTFGINGSLRKKEHIGGQQPVEYFLFNSASNLKAYSYDKTDFAYYGYNASNTRTYKLSCSGIAQWRNGILIRMNMQLQQAMFYPNAYINFNGNGEYTKHYYSGSERIASRLGNANMDITVTANARLTSRSTQLASRFQDDIRELMSDNSTVCPPSGISVNSLHQTGTSDIYYYHTNHLGSTAFVTDQNRNVTQGFLYAPFGEITTEYNATFGNDIIPKYSFNAKELDEETGMYYYEARYYKPPVFTSRDAMFEKYFWMTPYAYCANNPVKYVDPDGRIIDGVTYNKKTKSFTYSEEAIARGTDKYIEARMATKSGRRSIMLMVRNRRTTFTFYVVKEPLFGKNGDEYEQIDGITVLNNETMSNVSIYVSTYTFHSNELNPKDLSNVLIFDGEKVLFRQSIDKKNIKNPSYSNQWPILKKINDFIYDNPVRSEKEYIHAIGAHEEWHIYQKGDIHSQQNEKSAYRRELSARKEYWESVPDCLIY